jgi:hypothetical protein
MARARPRIRGPPDPGRRPRRYTLVLERAGYLVSLSRRESSAVCRMRAPRVRARRPPAAAACARRAL